MNLNPIDSNRIREGAPPVQCDLCGYAMPLPDNCAEQGEVVGLLVCTQCAEDNLASAVNPGATLELVGGCG